MDAPLSRFLRRRSQDRARRQRSFARTWRRGATSAVFAAVLLPLGGATGVRAAGPASSSWQGGSGHWSDVSHWAQGVPGSGTAATNSVNVTITHDSTDGDSTYGTFMDNGTGSFLLSGGSLTGGAIFINPSDLFQISGGATLRGAAVSGAGVTVSGSGTLDAVTVNTSIDMTGGSATILNGLTLSATVNVTNGNSMFLSGAQTVASGNGGTINLGTVGGSAGYIQLQGGDGAKTMTVGQGITVESFNGVIQNTDYGNTLDNKGTLAADAVGRTLSIRTAITNEGTIRASGNAAGGGTVTLGAAVNNATGTLSAGTNSVINLGGNIITGGTLTGGGTFAGGGTLSGVAFLGNSLLDLSNAGAYVAGGLTLNGTVNVANGQSLYLSNAQTVGSTAAGLINLGAVGGSAGYLQLQGVDGAKTMTVGAGVTVQGLNGIVQNTDYSNTLDNKGTLAADGAGHSLSVMNALTNEGTVRASGGGVIALTGGGSNSGHTLTADGAGSSVTLGGTFADAGGTLLATNGGTFILQGATVNGGTLSNNGGGGSPIAVVGTSTLNGVGGSLSFTAASAGLFIGTSASLIGTSSVTNGQSLLLSGTTALTSTATGVVNLGAVGGSNGYLQLQGIDAAKTDTIGAGVTIQGLSGVIQNTDYGNMLDNKGILAADGTGHTLAVGVAVSNGGTLRASGGGGVTLGNSVDNTEGGTRTTRAAQGTLSVDAGSTFNLAGQTITSGTLAGGGTFTGGGTLNGVLVNANLDLSKAGATFVNTDTLNGTATVANGNALTLSNAQTLATTSAALVNLGAVGGSNGYFQLQGVDGAKTMIVGPGVTVQGFNGIVQNTDYGNTLDNKGTLAADGTGHTLTLNTVVSNETIIRASGGGGVTLGASVDNTAGGALTTRATQGVMSVDAGSAFSLGGQTIVGGTLSGAGAFTGGGTLNGLLINANLDLSKAGATFVNTDTLNGTATVANGNALTLSNAQTLATTSAATVNLGTVGGPTGYLQLQGLDGAKTMIVGAGVTVQGFNGIVQNTDYGNTLDNKGTLAADGAGRILTINTTVVDEGNIRATGGGVVTVSGATTGTGTVNTGANSTVTFSGGSAMTQAAGTSQIDGIVNLGSGNTFTVGGGTLQGTGTVTGNVANTGGNVGPGDSPGTLTVSGNYSQGANGVLTIEYTAAPTGTTAHDLLAVGGTASLGGTLAVSFLGPRLPGGGYLATPGEPGASFDFLSFGTLANASLGTLFANEYTSSAFGVANGFYVNGIASNATNLGPAVYQLTQNGNVLHLNLQTAAAPEPSQWAGFGVGALGLGALALRARRRRAI